MLNEKGHLRIKKEATEMFEISSNKNPGHFTKIMNDLLTT